MTGIRSVVRFVVWPLFLPLVLLLFQRFRRLLVL
jgi:hypothetical protein